MHTKHFSHDLPMYQITLFFSLSDHPCPRIETSQRHTASQMEGAAVDNRSSSWSNRRKCWLARSIVWYQNLAMCEMDVGMGQHLWMTAQHISKYAMSQFFIDRNSYVTSLTKTPLVTLGGLSPCGSCIGYIYRLLQVTIKVCMVANHRICQLNNG